LFALSDDEIIKEDFCALLAQVTVNLPGRDSGKANYANTANSCNAILFECVKVIMVLDAPATLKKIGITVLSNFLTFKDINSRYISLRSLAVASQYHKKAVQKHLESIIECLNDTDISIRRMILEILKMITDESNIAQVSRTLFNDMLSCTPELLKDMTPSVCKIIELNAPTKVWYFDSMLRLLVIAGHYIEDETVNSLINLVSNTPQLQAYAMYKLYFAAIDNQNQEGLIKTLFYLLGELSQVMTAGVDNSSGQQLPKITEDKLVGLVIDIAKETKSKAVKQQALNSLIKLERKSRDGSIKSVIKRYIQLQTKSEDYESQTRAFEYSHLLEPEWSEWKEEIFQPMPAPDPSLATISE
jgi:AP-1 complex subunit gamma-1